MIPFIIRNSMVPKLCSLFISVYAITLFPFIFVKDNGNEVTVTHECIHIKQQTELLLIGFYLLYVWDWVVGLFKYRSFQTAYLRIRFEQEASAYENDIHYVKNRNKFSWKKYKV